MPKLSIITINYNNRDGLEKTIKSVIPQTFTDFEYIIIDGGSTDGSSDIISNYSKALTYWVSEKDSGIYNAMNKGIAKATGAYCLFLNSGDCLVNDSILKQVFSLNFSTSIWYGELIFNFGKENRQVAKRPAELSLYHLYYDNIWHPASFIKRTLFADIGNYNEAYKIAADYDFFFHAIAIKKVSATYIPFPISVYDTTGISTIASNLEEINSERKKIQRSYLSEKEILFLENWKKFKSKRLANWLTNTKEMNSIFNWLLKSYSKLRQKVN